MYHCALCVVVAALGVGSAEGGFLFYQIADVGKMVICMFYLLRIALAQA